MEDGKKEVYGKTNAGGKKRVLKYFLYYTELYVLCTLGGTVVMTLYMALLNNNISAGPVFVSVPSMILSVAVILILTSGMTRGQYGYSIPVSFGCIRKNVFLGNLMMDFFYIIQVLVLYETAVFVIQTRTETVKIPMPVLVSLLLFVEGTAGLLGAAAVKCGKLAYIFFIVLVIVGSIGVGILVGFSSDFGSETVIFYVFRGGATAASFYWILFAASAVLSAAANFANYRLIRYFEVRA